MEQVFLRVKSPDGEKTVELAAQPLTVGRHESNQLVIQDPLASRFHCVLEKSRTGAGALLRDLQSRNGTNVNGQRVMQANLKVGDVVSIGAIEMALTTRNQATENQIDELEIIEEDEEEPVPMPSVEGQSAARVLRNAADALFERSFGADAVQLINTRGKPLHDGEHAAGGEASLILRLILLICFRSHASDIHLEPRAEDFLLRLRMDGNLLDMTALNRDAGTKLTALIKILSELDTTQRNIVQEGHFATAIPNVIKAGKARGTPTGTLRRVDFRVSLVPALHGQKMVVRIFDAAHGPMMLEDLRLPPEMATPIGEELKKEAGLVLVCGPTGSGKTTTLYSLLRSCGSSFRNIITIEDPVEVQIEGTTQLPVDDENGKSFAALLRSVLRQDPDVIMVGEIRDPETAKIALQASMTGHLVLSTIHTRDTVGTIFRLLDLGIEPYMLAQGLHLVLSQRLVRALCMACRRKVGVTSDDRRRLGRVGENVEQIYAPVGCPKCLGTGFYGRRAFFEFLSTTDALREKMMHHPNLMEINELLGPEFRRLSDNGFQLVVDGVTSIDEVDRAVVK